MSNDFTQIMNTKSDSELLEIVTKLKDDYQPEAVHAAQAEIEGRGLSETQISKAEIELEEKDKETKRISNEPLSTGQKILFLFFFWGLIPIAMAGTFKANGQLKKYKDAWKCMRIGFAIYIGLVIFAIVVARISM